MSETQDTTAVADEAAEASPTETADGSSAGNAAGGGTGSASGGGKSFAAILSGHGLQIAGIAIFSAASIGGAVLLSGEVTLRSSPQQRDDDARREEERNRGVQERIDPSLTGNELVRMGEAALDEGRFDAARRILDAARTRVDTQDLNLRIDLFSALARAEELAGHDDLARLHRDYLGRLRESMGGSIKLFNEAERHFRFGRLHEARTLYSKFLLRPKDLEKSSERYLVEARDRLARIMEREFAAASPDAMKMPLEPESYFE